MILTDSILDSITNKGVYECILVKRRFSYDLFGDNMSPIGNIVSFKAPFRAGQLSLEDCLAFCIELPNVNIFGGVCFQRLFLAQIGSILSECINQECYVKDNCLIVEGFQATLTIINNTKRATLFNIVFCLQKQHDTFFVLNLDDINKFQEKVIESFHYLIGSVFTETQRDNF